MNYIYILLGFGTATVLMAYIPILSGKLKITYTLPILGLGVLMYYIGIPVEWPNPFWEHKWVKVITEIIVIISLMGAGLKIGLRYGREHWRNPLRLLHTTMPIYILAIFLVCYYLIGLDGASSLLLAAVCAPTDPVMATEMQLQDDGDSDKGKNTGMRYLLTAEAGLNDGMAFPFVYLAILWNKSGTFTGIDFWEWAGFYLLYKVIAGIMIGGAIGFCYSWTLKRLRHTAGDKAVSGFVAVALAIASFAIAEALYGYGFLSAFFTGLFAQYHNHRDQKDHSKGEMVFFTEELEKLLVVIWTLVFGGFLATGILGHTDFLGLLVAALIVLILRPLSAFLALYKTDFERNKKWAISFFGIKGIGSFFYLAYALDETSFDSGKELYAIVSWVVLFSIVVHGLTGPGVTSYFEKNNPG